jgi:hypothetical protein
MLFIVIHLHRFFLLPNKTLIQQKLRLNLLLGKSVQARPLPLPGYYPLRVSSILGFGGWATGLGAWFLAGFVALISLLQPHFFCSMFSSHLLSIKSARMITRKTSSQYL